jgi:hypothetical protein
MEELFSIVLVTSFILQHSCGVDISYSNVHLERLSFGSCSKQGKSAKLSSWPAVSKLKPQVWLWTGDAVYPVNVSFSALTNAYEVQLEDDLYSKFLSSEVIVDGTWVRVQ